MPKKTLSVYADPYAALDHEGRPAHACPTDPQHTGEIRRWVGAALSSKTRLVDRQDLDENVGKSVDAGLHEHPQETVFEFAPFESSTPSEGEDVIGGPITLPETPYYLERIRHGELIAADVKTAKKAGSKFSEPKALIAASRAASIAKWFAQHEEYPLFATKAEQAQAEADRLVATGLAPQAVPAKATKTTEASPSPVRASVAPKE